MKELTIILLNSDEPKKIFNSKDKRNILLIADILSEFTSAGEFETASTRIFQAVNKLFYELGFELYPLTSRRYEFKLYFKNKCFILDTLILTLKEIEK